MTTLSTCGLKALLLWYVLYFNTYYNIMIKYLILSAIGYFIFTNYITPMLEGNKPNRFDEHSERKNKNNHEDEYVDYEEVE